VDAGEVGQAAHRLLLDLDRRTQLASAGAGPGRREEPIERGRADGRRKRRRRKQGGGEGEKREHRLHPDIVGITAETLEAA
jgi:hypothetical protein